MNRPQMIEGNAVIASVTVRTTLANGDGNSARKIAHSSPSGIAMARAIEIMIKVPMIA